MHKIDYIVQTIEQIYQEKQKYNVLSRIHNWLYIHIYKQYSIHIYQWLKVNG
jgi:hypothetical protein